jgi:hypothetical protein
MDIKTAHTPNGCSKNQQQSDQHRLVENDAEITDYPINSYVLYTPSMGRNNKLLPKHTGPYQVSGHEHNLRPFIFDPKWM